MEATGTEVPTIPELFDIGVKSVNNPRLLNYRSLDGKWRAISAEEVRKRIRSIALGFSSLGISKGDRVSLLCENRPEWTLVDLSILSIGGILVPIYTTQALAQIEFIFSNAEPAWIVVSNRAFYDRVLPALEKFGLAQKLIVMETIPPIPHALSLDMLENIGMKLEKEDPQKYDEMKSRVKAGDLATIIYTADQSGIPKGVMLTHGNIVSNVLACKDLFPLAPSDDVALSYLPLSHIFERMIMHHYLYRQISVYYVQSIEHVAASLRQVKPTVMTTVPRLLEKVQEKFILRANKLPFVGRLAFNLLMKVALQYDPEKPASFFYQLKLKIADLLLFKQLRKVFGGRLRCVISGGAKLKIELAKFFAAGGIPVYQGYGLTETSPVISTNYPGKNRLGSVGPVIEGISVKIAEDGEILVRGPSVMQGYYKNPEATKRVFEGDWFKTGDMGRVDQDRFLYVTDRKKDLMKTSGGKYVAPQVIEDLLTQSGYLEKAAVIAEGRKFVSALLFPNLMALKEVLGKNIPSNLGIPELVSHPRVKHFFEKIVEEVNRHLSHWEAIRKFAVIVEPPAAPPDEAGLPPKARRKNLEDRYRKIIETFYSHAIGEKDAVSD